MITGYRYMGSELELARERYNWRAYLSGILKPYLGQEVLEVGAGIGSVTEALCNGRQNRWVCLEPDSKMVSELQWQIRGGRIPKCCQALNGVIGDLDVGEKFDTMIYCDVIEHIQRDKEELVTAAGHLRAGGVLAILAPAHAWLYAPFDDAVGHFRRYNRDSLSAIIPQDFACLRFNYLDSVGLLLSLGNRFVLRKKKPNHIQILVWDKFIIPVSQILDSWFNYRLGKSVLGVWQKEK